MSELQEPAYLIYSQRIQLESDVSVSTSAQRGPEALAHIPIIFLSPFPLSLPLFACPPLTPPSLVKQVDSTSITAKSVRGLRGPPGQAPRGVWGCRRVTPGSELLPRLELMAQFRDALLFLEEENNRASGREEIRKGWRREGESEKDVGEREG